MAKFILALDQGTTSSRAIVFDRRGQIIATAQQEFRQIFPQPGWVEHDAAEIWSTQLQCAQSALRQAGAKARDVAAIGVTNQRETTVIWDRATGAPIANAIVWQDRRTAERCRALRERGVEPRVTEQTGLLLDPYFSATKIEWLLDHVPGARARARARRAGVRHDRYVADLESDRRRRARHRRQQRVAHAAARPSFACMERRAARAVQRAARGVAARDRVERRDRHHSAAALSVSRSRSAAMPAINRPPRSARRVSAWAWRRTRSAPALSC